MKFLFVKFNKNIDFGECIRSKPERINAMRGLHLTIGDSGLKYVNFLCNKVMIDLNCNI